VNSTTTDTVDNQQYTTSLANHGLAIIIPRWSLSHHKRLSSHDVTSCHSLWPHSVTQSRSRRLSRNFLASYLIGSRDLHSRAVDRATAASKSGSPLGVRRRRQITSDRYHVRTTANWAKSDYDRTYHRMRRRLYLLNGLRQFASVANNSYRICDASPSEYPQKGEPIATTFVLSEQRSLTFTRKGHRLVVEPLMAGKERIK